MRRKINKMILFGLLILKIVFFFLKNMKEKKKNIFDFEFFFVLQNIKNINNTKFEN